MKTAQDLRSYESPPRTPLSHFMSCSGCYMSISIKENFEIRLDRRELSWHHLLEVRANWMRHIHLTSGRYSVTGHTSIPRYILCTNCWENREEWWGMTQQLHLMNIEYGILLFRSKFWLITINNWAWETLTHFAYDLPSAGWWWWWWWLRSNLNVILLGARGLTWQPFFKS